MKELNQIKEVSNYFILFISIFILLVIIQISNCVKNPLDYLFGSLLSHIKVHKS